MKLSIMKSILLFTQITVMSIVLVGCSGSGSSTSASFVPSIIGLFDFDAELLIDDSGLMVGIVMEEYSDSVEAGVVISQSPDATSKVERGSSVDMVVSLGALVTGVTETCMLPGGVPLEMVYIESGTFMMGAYVGEQSAESDEYPQHEVTLTQGYWMGKYEVTKAQWFAVMGTEHWVGQQYILDDDDSPLCYVGWNIAHSFITELNLLTGKTFRLPSEAEWEYAARAGTTTRFYWGDDPSHVDGDNFAWWQPNAWYADEKYAHVVGMKTPNAWGLYDMIGNVWEWCEDIYRADYYTYSPLVDPTGPPLDSNAVLRGGSFGSAPSYSRSAKRYDFYLGYVSSSIGFRLSR